MELQKKKNRFSTLQCKIKPAPGGCATVGGEDIGTVCAFPFTHDGESYDKCTWKDARGEEPWCSTNKKWGRCGDLCPSGKRYKTHKPTIGSDCETGSSLVTSEAECKEASEIIYGGNDYVWEPYTDVESPKGCHYALLRNERDLLVWSVGFNNSTSTNFSDGKDGFKQICSSGGTMKLDCGLIKKTIEDVIEAKNEDANLCKDPMSKEDEQKCICAKYSNDEHKGKCLENLKANGLCD
jgi:hypothetical protein